mmetsp:Transcript_63197/g.111654  ORF Transcript_63197/g.111654 Transcript_63197/m.111654 type:complete len:361 (-) Transcript_63197:72-1154(-)
MPAAQQYVTLHGAVHVERGAPVRGLDPAQLHLAWAVRGLPLGRGTCWTVPLGRRRGDELPVLEQLHVRTATLAATFLGRVTAKDRDAVDDHPAQKQRFGARLHAIQHIRKVLNVSALRRNGQVVDGYSATVGDVLQRLHGRSKLADPGHDASHQRSGSAFARQTMNDGDVLFVCVQPALHRSANFEQQTQWRRRMTGKFVLQYLVCKLGVVITLLTYVPNHKLPFVSLFEKCRHDVDIISHLCSRLFCEIARERHRHNILCHIVHIQPLNGLLGQFYRPFTVWVHPLRIDRTAHCPHQNRRSQFRVIVLSYFFRVLHKSRGFFLSHFPRNFGKLLHTLLSRGKPSPIVRSWRFGWRLFRV